MRRMGIHSGPAGALARIVFAAILLAFSLGAGAAGFQADWQENVQLQDGNSLLVHFHQLRAGAHQPGKPIPVKALTIDFKKPGSGESITWKTRFGLAGLENVRLLAIDVVGDDLYLVTAPVGMGLARWGHPDPPYVFFKYSLRTIRIANKTSVEAEWRRISIQDLPEQIKQANVVIDTIQFEETMSSNNGPVTPAQIKHMNDSAADKIRPHWLTFVRTPFRKQEEPQE